MAIAERLAQESLSRVLSASEVEAAGGIYEWGQCWVFQDKSRGFFKGSIGGNRPRFVVWQPETEGGGS